MLKKTFALAALAGAALLSTTPALADGYRGGHGHKRVVLVQQHAPHYAQHPWERYRQHAYRSAYAYQRPVFVRQAPVVADRHRTSHTVLGGLIASLAAAWRENRPGPR